jgi:hypothetical protein
MSCNSIIIYKNSINKCSNKNDVTSREEKYCSIHKYQYRFESDNCAICLEKINENEEQPLLCGHWFHSNCLKQCNKYTCPYCSYNYATYKETYKEIFYFLCNNLGLVYFSLALFIIIGDKILKPYLVNNYMFKIFLIKIAFKIIQIVIFLSKNLINRV